MEVLGEKEREFLHPVGGDVNCVVITENHNRESSKIRTQTAL